MLGFFHYAGKFQCYVGIRDLFVHVNTPECELLLVYIYLFFPLAFPIIVAYKVAGRANDLPTPWRPIHRLTRSQIRTLLFMFVYNNNNVGP